VAFLILAALAAATGTPEPGRLASAADGAGASVGQACELHVWPGHGFHTVYYGWVHGGTVDGALKGRQGYQQMPTDPLSAERQAALLRDLHPAELLGLAGFTTVVHDEPLSSRAIRSGTARHAADAPDCYAELMVDDLVIQDHVLGGKALNILYRFRRFAKGDTPSRSYGTFIVRPLHLFPPAASDENPQPALDELVTAYRTALAEFGQALQRPPSARKGRSN
jgi:hypothetical protein